MEDKEIKYLEEKAKSIRINALRAICKAGSGHPGGSLSIADILSVLYFKIMNIEPGSPKMEGRDKLILSKGHAVPALYAALGEKGFFDIEEMMSLRKINSKFQGHPNMNKVPGIEMSTGSLGQGFSAAVGMASASKLKNENSTIYVITGDGELQEGIIWEAALSAAQRKLGNFVAIIDNNKLQIDGEVTDVKNVMPIDEKFGAFGFKTISINGHSITEIVNALEEAKEIKDMPVAVIADTYKGYGVSFMQDQAGWHGKAPTEEELEKAIKEILGR